MVVLVSFMKSLTLPLLSTLMLNLPVAHADVTVYAAASLTDVMGELNKMYEKKYRTKVKTSYASSGTLAKQIEQGGKADVFISADVAWMTHLNRKNLISPTNTTHLLGNRLVIISPAKNPIKVTMSQNFNISGSFTGKLCTGNTASVPVGKYAKEALTHMTWWQSIRPRLVETEDVRVALNFVARGECPLGIVYATDAISTQAVKTVATFPTNSHTPIIYPAGLVRPNNSNAKRFYQFLQSDDAKAVFKKHGFTPLK